MTKTFSIEFDKFSLEFDICIKESIWESKNFDSLVESNSYYAVAEIFLNTASERLLIASRFSTGNLLILLSAMKKQLALSLTPDIKQFIKEYGWFDWMKNYWQCIYDGREISSRDEFIYDNLMGCSIINGIEGGIVFYRICEIFFIEISFFVKKRIDKIFCTRVDFFDFLNQINDIEKKIILTLKNS